MSPVADTPLPVNSPPSFHLLAKPRGATCNIDCKYCFFLSKEALYPNDKQRMSGEPGQNYLRAGLELFFKHTRPAMRTMAQLLQQHRPPSDVMALTAAEDDQRGPYQPCPCGSGRKFRFCHGNNAPRTPLRGVTPVRDESQTVSDAAYGAST